MQLDFFLPQASTRMRSGPSRHSPDNMDIQGGQNQPSTSVQMKILKKENIQLQRVLHTSLTTPTIHMMYTKQNIRKPVTEKSAASKCVVGCHYQTKFPPKSHWFSIAPSACQIGGKLSRSRAERSSVLFFFAAAPDPRIEQRRDYQQLKKHCQQLCSETPFNFFLSKVTSTL